MDVDGLLSEIFETIFLYMTRHSLPYIYVQKKIGQKSALFEKFQHKNAIKSDFSKNPPQIYGFLPLPGYTRVIWNGKPG